MSKPLLLFRGPVATRSGYGSHSRDVLEALYQMDLFDIKIDSCSWGHTPMNALENNNPFHTWIQNNIITSINEIPFIYVQVTVPNEFQRMGKFNIGITAGIETTIAPKEWIDGCNKMDLTITTSQFSKDVLLNTFYNEHDTNNVIVKEHKILKPVEVLFEGVDTDTFNDNYKYFNLNVKEKFCFLFVGHWLNGNIGEDRKNVGMLIKCFNEAFKDTDDKPGLILKTSSATFSVKEREEFRKKIQNLVNNTPNPPSIYLLFGDLTNNEMNELYNHPNVKTMISLTKGEGFGRPLLEFTMTGKPVIASNWSGHKDFLPMDKSILIGGQLTQVDNSVINKFIIKESKWFTVNYNEVVEVMKIVKNEYDRFLEKSKILGIENKENFSLYKMRDKLKEMLLPLTQIPQEYKLILPELKKLNNE
jgi:glycosyltransferase involved in cell wall biosynthesis